MKIILIGGNFSNKGAEAMIFSTERLLKKYFLSPEIIIVSSRKHKKFDTISIKYVTGVLSLVLYTLLKKIPFLNKKIDNKALLKFEEADIIINIGGFILTDNMNIFTNFSYFLYAILCRLLNKPHILYPQDFGPFNSKIKAFFAKITIGLSELVMVRSEQSKKNIKNIGIKKKIYIFPDIAFNFPASPIEKSTKILEDNNIQLSDRKTVCISPNWRLYDRCDNELNNNYIEILSDLVNTIQKEFDANILFLPHEFKRDEYDDRLVVEKVLNNIDEKRNVYTIEKEYSASDLKSIIKKMDIIIASRFHCAVAALSLIKPTLTIGWADKYKSLLKTVNLDKYSIDYKKMNSKIVNNKFIDLWSNKNKIMKDLGKKIPEIKNDAEKPGRVLKELITDEID